MKYQNIKRKIIKKKKKETIVTLHFVNDISKRVVRNVNAIRKVKISSEFSSIV